MRRKFDLKPALEPVYTSRELSVRVRQLAKTIARDYGNRTVDVVIMLENAFVFAADLLRGLPGRVVCHFVRTEVRDIQFGTHDGREIFFSRAPRIEDRDVLVVDGIIQTGLTQDFLLKRLQESRPRSLRLAVLFDRPRDRRVDLKPDYFCFVAASKYLAGYGLAGSRGWYRNLPYVGVQPRRASASGTRQRSTEVRRVRSK